jgi:hypothetical protein
MNEQIVAALVILVIAILTGLTGFVTVWFQALTKKLQVTTETIETKLDANTELTTQSRDLSNGRLTAALNQITKYRLLYERYERIIREMNTDPASRAFVDAAADRIRTVEFDREWAALQNRLVAPTDQTTGEPH